MKSGIQYIVVLDEPCNSLVSTALDSRQRKLLVAALTHVYMSNGPVKEGKNNVHISDLPLLNQSGVICSVKYISGQIEQQIIPVLILIQLLSITN